MKKILAGLTLIIFLMACTNANENNQGGNGSSDHLVDTSVIGSDNPNPLPDTTDPNYRLDSLAKK